MTVEEWLDGVKKSGLLCGKYEERIRNAKSRRQMMDIVLDANGISFLQEMMEKGHPIPYSVISEDFNAYINGRYVYNGDGYTGSVYFEQKDEITVTTTIASLLCCECAVKIPERHICRIYCDRMCDIKVVCPNGSKVKVYLFGGAVAEDACAGGDVEIIRR